jgi:hypothetical protein
MLRITVQNDAQTVTLQLEGRLAGPWLEELDETFQRALVGKRQPKIEVDLTGLISIDRGGKTYLESMHQRGVEFIVGDCETKSIVDEISSKSATARRD